jgi:hypothetical protein
MWNFLCARDDAYLVKRSDLGAQATVHAKHFPIDNGTQRHEVKNLAACLPDGSIAIFLETLFIESVHLRDLTGLVIAPYERYPVRVSIYRSAEATPTPVRTVGCGLSLEA